MDNSNITNRFQYHPPDVERAEVHRKIRESLSSMALWMNDVLPEGREKSLVITKLEESMFWANAALARPK